MTRRSLAAGAIVVAASLVYALIVRGDIAPNLRIGRRTRNLGPIRLHVAASPEEVFDVIASPYLGRTPKALGAELKVLERGTDMVLAEHYTKTLFGLTSTTTETVRFERPTRITFQLVRGPVPHVGETFELVPSGEGTEFRYSGDMTTDLWAVGAGWGKMVASTWERTVRTSMAKIVAEAERRDASRR